jgi:hypothetical protein
MSGKPTSPAPCEVAIECPALIVFFRSTYMQPGFDGNRQRVGPIGIDPHNLCGFARNSPVHTTLEPDLTATFGFV